MSTIEHPRTEGALVQSGLLAGGCRFGKAHDLHRRAGVHRRARRAGRAGASRVGRRRPARWLVSQRWRCRNGWWRSRRSRCLTEGRMAGGVSGLSAEARRAEGRLLMTIATGSHKGSNPSCAGSVALNEIRRLTCLRCHQPSHRRNRRIMN
jgi:hypothetical protein